MNNRYPLGQVGRLSVSASPSAAGGGLLLLVLFTLLGRIVFRLRPGAALTGGLLATALHFFSEMWHQSGHARAAENTGYPMTGVHFWGVLATSLYPSDEPELPGEIHVARAWGGPRASVWFAAVGALVALATRPLGGIAHMVSALFALENTLVFTLGALVPLPFLETDGVILQRYQRDHRKRMVTIQE